MPSQLAQDLNKGGISKEEYYAALQTRKETERVAALPITKLKSKRDKFKTASSLVESESWDALRDLIQDTTGAPFVAVVNEGKFDAPEIRTAAVKVRKLVFDVDKFAYSQQSFPGSDVLSGYCAPGVVPREKGGCKPKPVVEKAPLLAKLKDAAMVYDEVVRLCE